MAKLRKSDIDFDYDSDSNSEKNSFFTITFGKYKKAYFFLSISP